MPRFILHTTAPFSSLPSFTPASLSALLYMHQAVPSYLWNAVYSTGSFGSLRFSDFVESSPSTNKPRPSDDVISLDALPCLQDNLTETLIYGFDSITSHLRSVDSAFDLDGHLDASQRADLLAYTALLHTRLAPLIASQVFGSSTNWNANNGVRTALASHLSFPYSWLIPGRIRDRYTEDAERRGYLGSAIESAVGSVPSSWRGLSSSNREKDWDAKNEKPPPKKSEIQARVNLRRAVLDAVEPFERLRKANSPLLGKTTLRVQLSAWMALGMLEEFPVTPLAEIFTETVPGLVEELRLSSAASATSKKGQDGDELRVPGPDYDLSIPVVERTLGTVWTAISGEVARGVYGITGQEVRHVEIGEGS